MIIFQREDVVQGWVLQPPGPHSWGIECRRGRPFTPLFCYSRWKRESRGSDGFQTRHYKDAFLGRIFDKALEQRVSG